MNKQNISKFFYLVTTNIIFSFLILFIYKIFRNNFNSAPLIQSMYEDTKILVLQIFMLFLVFITTLKLQIKVFYRIKENNPLLFTLLKLTYILMISLALSCMVNYFFQYFQLLKDPLLTVEWIIENTAIYFSGVLYLFFIFLFSFALIGNVFISSLLTSFILVGIGFIHYNKLNLRSEPLFPYDYKQFNQMKDVIPMITQYVSISQIIGIVFLLCLIGIVFLIFIRNIRIAYWQRIIIFVLASFMVYSYTFFPKTFMESFVKKSDISIIKWNQLDNYEVNGFLFGFISNIQNDTFTKPQGYSKKRVLETAQKYINSPNQKTGNTNKAPNIIYLMSESFWDPTRLNVEFSEDPIPYLRQLMTEHSSGYVLSPVFGGATANVEFEALTGFTTSFLNSGAIAYQDIADKKTFIPSIVSNLEEKGYKSLAIHPYNKVFYKRNVVYNTFGFDKFLDQDTMKNNKRKPGRVITDLSLTHEILDSIKNQDKPLFIHAVSMQNHMPYNPGAYNENKIKVSDLSPESTSTLEVYTEGIRRSDEALQVLVEGLEELNEPTIVVFWGDHLPILGENMSIYKEAGYDDENPTLDEYKYSETPLLIYSNIKSEKQQYEFISPFNLAPIVYELAGLEQPPFYNLLNKLRMDMAIPALKGQIIMRSDRKFETKPSKELQQLLEDYRLLQYDLLVGKQYSLDLLYR